MKKIIAFVFFALAPLHALALMDSVPLAADPRIREVPYNKNEVYKFTGHYKIQASIEFGQYEDVKTISVGDSEGWQIVPAGNRIFLKPVELDADTNMTVITSENIYQFELHAKEPLGLDDPDLIFVMRFVYPSDSSISVDNYTDNSIPTLEIAENPQKYNFNYTISGNKEFSPIRIFDDGEFTFFQFKDINGTLPAFFMVDSERRESLINYRTVGDYVVVERVAQMFTLRNGHDVVCVFNETNPLELRKGVPNAEEDESNPFD